MKKAKENKGITLASLVITVIVLIILATVGTYSGAATLRYMKYAKAKTQIETMQSELNSWYQSYKNGNTIVLNYGTAVTYADYSSSFERLEVEAGDESISKYKLFTPKYIEETLGIGGIDYEFIINVQDRKIALAEGLTYQGVTYYTPEDFGITNVENVPISSVYFELAYDTNSAGEAIIILHNLKFYAGNNEANVSKFSIEYTNDGTNWNTTKITNKAKSTSKITYNGLTAYSLPVTKSGTYEVIIKQSNGDELELKEGTENTITISKIPDYWEVIPPTEIADWYSYKNELGVSMEINTPKLANGMVAIKYAEDNGNITNGSKWANAITKDGSMWVWIPRFAYQITNGYHKSGEDINVSNPTQGVGNIKIAFLDKEDNFLDPTITGTVVTAKVSDVTYGDETRWILAPAFDFGGEQIEGFWFAKFEASNTDGYGSSIDTANNTSLTMQIKPNVTSWRNITPENIFTVCYNLATTTNNTIYFNDANNVDTHMTKNVEWGAVTYLTHSIYGRNGEKVYINNNSNFITGISGDTVSANSSNSETNKYNTQNGVNASTTKNVYGIYDMSGGSSEYVAGCLEGKENSLTSDTSKISKYIDVYSEYSISKYGDAVYETSTNTNTLSSWFNESSAFVNAENPVFKRGGDCTNKAWAGLFHYNYYLSGTVNYKYRGFRPVCVVH